MANYALAVLGTASVPSILASETGQGDTVVKRDSSGNVVVGNDCTASTILRTLGSLFVKATAKTATFTADTTTTVYEITTAGGAVTVNLPAVASYAGQALIFFKTNSGTNLILDGNSSETVNGAATLTTTVQYAAAIIFPNVALTGWNAILVWDVDVGGSGQLTNMKNDRVYAHDKAIRFVNYIDP